MEKIFNIIPSLCKAAGYVGIGIGIALFCERLYLDYTYILFVLSGALVALSHIAEHKIVISDDEEEEDYN